VCRRYGWSPRGQKVHGAHSGHRRPRTRLIAARRGKDFLAPLLFSGTADTDLVNRWFDQMLGKTLRPNSTIVFDNAALHKKKDLEAIAHQPGHHILFLPPYSPDFSPVEHDFANIKKIRQYAQPISSLDAIIKLYENYLE
jgi:putative transposase